MKKRTLIHAKEQKQTLSQQQSTRGQGKRNDGVMLGWPEKGRAENQNKQAKDTRRREDMRDSLETKHIENSHLTGAKVKQS